MLHLMSRSGGGSMKQVAMSMQTKIFYDRTLFLDKVVFLVRSFDVAKYPRSYV